MLFQQELAGCITEEAYAAAIPVACSMPMQIHMESMLCWGLLASIEKGHRMDCSRCDETKEAQAARIKRIEERRREQEQKQGTTSS